MDEKMLNEIHCHYTPKKVYVRRQRKCTSTVMDFMWRIITQGGVTTVFKNVLTV